MYAIRLFSLTARVRSISLLPSSLSWALLLIRIRCTDATTSMRLPILLYPGTRRGPSPVRHPEWGWSHTYVGG